MTTENAIYDWNWIRVALWMSSLDSTETVMIRVNPVNWALKCEFSIPPIPPSLIDWWSPSSISTITYDWGLPWSIPSTTIDWWTP